jgi:hypothetical protein
MWDCPACNCQAIAGSLEFCPMCRADRPPTAAPEAPLDGPEPSAPGRTEAPEGNRPAPPPWTPPGDLR